MLKQPNLSKTVSFNVPFGNAIENTPTSYFNKSLSFVNKLEGFKTTFKSLHWSAPQLTYHRAIDDLLSSLSDFQDEIAETSQGYCGRQYNPKDVYGIKYDYSDGIIALNELNKIVNEFHISIKNDDELSGVINVVNDFQTTLLKTKYLFNLASKD